MSASGLQSDFRFTQHGTKMVNNIRFIGSVGSGTIPTYWVGIQVDDNTVNHYPSGIYLTSNSFNTTGWNSITVPQVQLTDGQIYHIVISYDSGAISGSNYMSLWDGTVPYTGLIPLDQSSDQYLNTLEYNGTSWALKNMMPPFVLGYADGSYYGNPIYNGIVSSVYGANQAAEFLTPPADCQVSVLGAYFYSYNGTPTDDMHYLLYDVTGNVTVTSGVIAAAASVQATVQWYFTEHGRNL